MAEEQHFDVVIVGSGFGGSVMAHRLATAGKKVCVLERGQRYPPGSFPRSPREVADSMWDRSRGMHGLFDFWSFDGLEALVASGLGGGSLIYANVLMRMPKAWFVVDGLGRPAVPWPVQYDDLAPHYDAAEDILGATPYPYAKTRKTAALGAGAATVPLQPVDMNLAVTFAANGGGPVPGQRFPSKNLHGAERSTCRLCGECDIGCNYGSKNTLDFNYLSGAQDAGACIRTRSEVLRFEPHAGAFEITYAEHDPDLDGRPLREWELPQKTITANRLVLSAGTLATTHLMLRNRAAVPHVSHMLGSRFSGNGDLLSFVSRADRLLDPCDGPVITAAYKADDALEGGDGRGFVLEDGGYPDFFNWIAQVPSYGTVKRGVRFVLRRLLARVTGHPRSEISGEISDVLGQQRTAYSMPLLGMGRDIPDGVMSLRDDWLAVDWTTRTSAAYIARVREAMNGVARSLGGRLRDHPLTALRRVITVHPCGGCPMGRSKTDGVVDRYGRVFGYPGLYIADGSVMPSPPGANPSLTIAALSDSFAEHMINEGGW